MTELLTRLSPALADGVSFFALAATSLELSPLIHGSILRRGEEGEKKGVPLAAIHSETYVELLLQPGFAHSSSTIEKLICVRLLHKSIVSRSQDNPPNRI